MFQSNETTFFLHWNNIHWNICGKLTSSKDVTNEQLSSLKEGDYLVISPVPSKSDQFNTVWGSHPLYVPFHDRLWNAVAAVADLALHIGTELRQPGRPVFVSKNGSACKAEHMVQALHKAMTEIAGQQRAKLYTWHSPRIYLTTHLLSCNVKPAVIQALLRWQTDESLRAYART